MKLNRSQKASLLKEIGNLISYFQTFEHMDVDKLINIMKEKYSSWKDANSTELYDDVNHVVATLQNLIEEKVVKTTTGDDIEDLIDVRGLDKNVLIDEINEYWSSFKLENKSLNAVCMEVE